MSKNVTLQDVSDAAGVAVGTVHKALHGQKGVSPKKRDEILKIAASLHYCTIDTVSEKSFRIAAVFPKPTHENKYFYTGLWQGLHNRAHELSPFRFAVDEYPFEGGTDKQLELLEHLYDTQRDTLDALITIIWNERLYTDLINRFTQAGVKIFTVSADAPSSKRICTIMTNPYRTGRLAAEFLGARVSPEGRVVIIGTKRDTINHAHIVRGFFDEMLITNPTTEIVELYESVHYPEKLYETVVEFLGSFDNIRGIYANNARATAGLCNALSHSKIKHNVQIVGSELFTESASYLRSGMLCALIDQNAYKQGYTGINMVFENIVRNQKIPSLCNIEPSLLLKNNLPLEYL
ncbi:MAG: LacI family DNA-binding transcriptional regulator [Oscillospiraceae bacterium]